ncbi:hypothetical protein [Sedimentitalea sp.]|uniref:hypothetical protein n=1 Tax=Sedimentitalea sp. TaxID=2048915 RepID=UPI003296A761
MDEPFSALDAGLREHLQIEVEKLRRWLGVTTIFVTHDQNEAISIADRIVILDDGRIEQAGTPTVVNARPKVQFIAEFMETNNIITLDFTRGGDAVLDGNTLRRPKGEMASLQGRHKVAIRPEYLRLKRAPEDRGGLIGTVNFVRLLGASIETDLAV